MHTLTINKISTVHVTELFVYVFNECCQMIDEIVVWMSDDVNVAGSVSGLASSPG